MKVHYLLLASSLWGAVHSADISQRDISLFDCQNEANRKEALQELIELDVYNKPGLKDIDRACSQLTRNKKIDAKITPLTKNLSENMEAFVQGIKAKLSICRDRSQLRSLAVQYKLSTRTGVFICSRIRKDILSATDPNSPNIAEQNIALDDFLQDISLKRNPYITGLRIRFGRAHKPGVDPGVVRPQELLDRNGESWYCIANQPFVGNSSMYNTSISQSMVPLSFNSIGPRLWDSHNFLYDSANGFELTGGALDGTVLRHLRLEYFCEKQNWDCDETNHDLKVLLIEESVKTKGLLSRIFGWFSSLGTSVRGAVHSFLSARARRSQSDYLSENDKTCSGWRLLTGCEMAINYYECWDDREHALGDIKISSLGNP